MNKGKLIVFEGADGSGKTTQAKLLLKYLKARKIPSTYISFPRYEESLWGGMVKRYLLGDFGKLDDVDPYLASVLYSGDRFSAASIIRKWLDGGKIVVCNRYIGSNIGHMGAKIKNPADAKALAGRQNERSKFIKWLEDLEYRENGIPKEDLVIFLRVPVEISRGLIKGRTLDIHEKDLEYLGEVIDVYDWVSRQKKYWEKVDCSKDGKIIDPSTIHQRVLEILRNQKLI